MTAEIDKAKIAYKTAYESGDPDALIEAQAKLSELQVEKSRYDNYRPQPRPEPEPEPLYEQENIEPPKPSEMGMKWAEKNTWFQNDPEMTGYAFGVHEKLIKSGVAPDTEEYYSKIDDAVRRVFPDKFDDGPIIEESAPQRQTGNVVAPAAKWQKTTQSATDLNASLSRQEAWSVK